MQFDNREKDSNETSMYMNFLNSEGLRELNGYENIYFRLVRISFCT